MNKRIVQILGPVIAILLFGAALYILHHELRHYTYHDIVGHLKSISKFNLALAFMLTISNFLVLTGYDALAVRYIRHPLSYSKTAFTSFVGYAFSQGLGFPMLTGGSLRFRLYSGWGLSALEIANIVAFNGLTFWMGYLVLASMAFLIEPYSIPAMVHLPFHSIRIVGVLMLLVVLGYFLLGVLRERPFKVWKWEFPVPPPKYFFAQISVSCMDWAVAASVLYVLLPYRANLSYQAFLGVFLLAQFLGIMSHIPGGLGVFETIVVFLLSPTLPAASVVGSLVAYRAVYYLLPLVVAAVFFAGNELVESRVGFEKAAEFFGKWIPSLVPQVLAYSVFVAGTILLFSGATPAEVKRLTWLQDFVPLPVMEFSHFLGSLSGMALLILARGIQRRLDAAYFLTAAMLGAGIAFSLLKGFDYEEALILSIMMLALLPSRKYFYRKASLFSRSFTPGWISAIIIVFICSVWLGIFSYKHLSWSSDMWWQFEFSKDYPRFLRASVGAAVLAMFFAMAILLRPAPPEPDLPDEKELEKARGLAVKSRDTSVYLALLGDKELLFSANGNAFIMFGISGRSWISLGDPVGDPLEWPELAWRFQEMADRHGGQTIFYEVGSHNYPLYLDLGLNLLKIGEEARVSLPEFDLHGPEKKHFRNTRNRLEKEGFTFEVLPPTGVEALMPALKSISDQWLTEKRTREKGFSLGFFSPKYLRLFPLGIVKKEGRMVAFANIWPSADKEEFSVDLMRYLPESEEGVMDYLFIELMFYAKQEQYKWFNLGMAPLAGLEDYSTSPIWSRLANMVYRYGENFYNFQGVRQYKQKFNPVWEPKFLASPGGIALPAVFADLTILTSRGIRGVVTK
jgi:phosphatidylglycerol lysyltransferase